MTKYYFVLYHARYREFLDELRESGLVDITTTGWEPKEEDRDLLTALDKHRSMEVRLNELRTREGYEPGKPYISPQEAYDKYIEATTNIDSLNSQLQRVEKEEEALRPWGDFDPKSIVTLAKAGMQLRFFTAFTRDYDDNIEQWSADYNIERINDENGTSYFVVMSAPGDEILINAQEVKTLTTNYKEKSAEIKKIREQVEQWEKELSRVAESGDALAEHENQAKELLQYEQVSESGKAEAEGSLMVLQGWATRATSDKVDAIIEANPDVVYLKSNPTPEDETPVLLKNNKFTKPFEFIGDFYALPKYGTTDLTPYFAPFYMIFFGFCLAEAGYGLIIVLAGLYMLIKGSPTMKDLGKLTLWCGGAAIVFGLMSGSFFGVQIADLPAFTRFRDYFLTSDHLFSLALVLGVVQILFAMIIKMISQIQQLGLKYAWSTIGWFIVLVATLCAIVLPAAGVNYGFSSIFYLIPLCIGGFIMLFLNSPGKNPLVNFGAGLWNAYNDITGFIGDFLSYIRLFAIGLSGGILALVFNELAFGLSPDIPVLRQIIIVIILLIGHGINLFMSILSSFVHPIRLTFVEFYKNAGFEAGQRAFTPFKKNNKE